MSKIIIEINLNVYYFSPITIYLTISSSNFISIINNIIILKYLYNLGNTVIFSRIQSKARML